MQASHPVDSVCKELNPKTTLILIKKEVDYFCSEVRVACEQFCTEII